MGFDPEDFDVILPVRRDESEAHKIWLVYTGRLYQEARNPVPFIDALAALCQESPQMKMHLSVYFVGQVDGSIKNIIDHSPVNDVIKIIPWVPTSTSIAWMKAADYLLLFGNRGEIQIPGKVYQYIGSGKPIFLMYSSANDPTIEIVSSVEESIVVDNSVPSITRAIKHLIETRFKNRPNHVHVKNVSKVYSWPSLASKVGNIFLQLIVANNRTRDDNAQDLL
jgi:hypothetical protein